MKPMRGMDAQNKPKDETPEPTLAVKNDPNANKILQISQLEGFFQEKFKLDTPVEVDDEIEGWLERFEDGVKKSIFSAVTGLCNGGLFDLKENLKQYSLQICSLAFSVIMTKEISELNHLGTPNQVNQLKSNLSKILQSLISALDSEISKVHCHSYEYFISVIRNYISFLDLYNSKNQDNHPFWSYSFDESNIVISAMQWNYKYGFEYLGMDKRLVLLPDWRNLYSNLIQNIFFDTASILIGPAGSFKTGLLNELASIFGYKCITVDCGPTCSIKRLTRMLENALLTKSWAVLKNIDSFDSDFLSLINYYVKLSKKSFAMQNDKEFKHDDIIISGINLESQILQPILATATFSSMENFSVLHENIRLSFRPISTYVPSMDVFAYLRLYSSGFRDYHDLGDKFNTVLKSIIGVVGWFNYKIGIRLISKMLDIAATNRVKLQLKASNEGQALASSIHSCISPLLSGSEHSILKDILKVAFPEVPSKNKVILANHWLEESMLELKLSLVSSYVEKLECLFDILESNQLAIVLGNHLSGKTSGIKALQHHISKSRQQCLPPLSLHEYYFGSLSFHELIGQSKEGAWTSGLIANAFNSSFVEAQKMSKMLENIPESKMDYIYGQTGMNWILFHGDLTPQICDYITHLLFSVDHISESECRLSSFSKLLFEVNDLKSVSPSFITRVSVVHFGSFIEPHHVFQHTIGVGLPPFVEGHDSFLNSIFEYLVLPTINFVSEKGVGLRHDINALIRNMGNFLTSLVHSCGSRSYDQFIIGEQRIFLVSQALLSIIWTFGMVVNRSDFSFDSFCREELFCKGIVEIEKLHDNCNLECVKLLPKDGSVYDYFFEPKLWSWNLWDDLVPYSSDLSERLVSSDDEIIFTSDMVRYSYFGRVLLEQNHHFVVAGAPGIGKSTLLNACLRENNFPNFKIKIKGCLDSSYNSEKLRQFVFNIYKKDEHELDKSCTQNRRLILFIDDMENITANDDNCAEICTLIKMSNEMGKWPAENPSSLKDVSGLAICGAVDMAFLKQSEPLSKISSFFHYFELDYSNETLEAIVNSVLHPAIM
jgi:hypothetical protein